jgi:hypothetical protein
MGALLPVPLFVGIYFFTYFYASYHGFDHETQTYIQGQENLRMARRHLITDVLLFLAVGYLLMGVPSLVYSFLLERRRASSRFAIRSYIGLGVLLGGVAGFIATFFMVTIVPDALLLIATSCAVGGLIPSLLALVFPERPLQENLENHSAHPTAGGASV